MTVFVNSLLAVVFPRESQVMHSTCVVLCDKSWNKPIFITQHPIALPFHGTCIEITFSYLHLCYEICTGFIGQFAVAKKIIRFVKSIKVVPLLGKSK